MSQHLQWLDELIETFTNVVELDGYRNGYPTQKHLLEPIARILLMGVYDDNNIFSKLRGMRYIVKRIWQYTLQFNQHHWRKYIDHWESLALISSASNISLPEPQDININMMPFIMNHDFDKTKLPNYLKGYHHIIQLINKNDPTQSNTICYLTIHESFVHQNKTQRRPGLHVETPGKCGNIFTIEMDEKQHGNGDGHGMKMDKDRWITWGRGFYRSVFNQQTEWDGIYMLSSVDQSCIAWDCSIDGAVIGHLGDIEHLRKHLKSIGLLGTHWGGKRRSLVQMMRKGQLYWLTDRTPHQSLPMKHDGYRQFFRLVTHCVDVWYEQHSTKNPNGVEPDPNRTRIVKGNKFDKRKT